MSTELLGLVWPLQLPPTQKVVMLAVADRVHRDSNGAYPSVATLALDSCLSVRAVREALRGLEAAGLISTRLRSGTSSYYVPNIERLEDLHEERRQARRAAQLGPAEPAPTPAPPAGVPRHHVPGGAAPRAGDPGTTCRLTLIPNTNTSPHTPQPSAGGLAGVAAQGGPTAPMAPSDPPAPAPSPTPAPPAAPVPAPPKPKARREGRPALGMAAWLEQVAAAGEKAIPADDPVYRYAATVRIGEDLLLLCWREFKRRQLAGSKRQKDWRQTFRNCVQGSWYRLWFLKGDEPAQLTSAGEQVRRFFEAEDEAQRGQEGGGE